ncbi:sulfurtransferase TusA family protein [Kordiimonas aquimaris]|uniref:sulfurtransferase TusA family protein n=1 Tax=Kordiimonas aquimaris TaxID=707591 RepID=UPI00374CFAE8
MNDNMQPNFSEIDLDLRGVYCPMAFVKLRIHADQLPDNAEFTVVFDNTKANEPLVRSVKSLGHLVATRKNTHHDFERDDDNSHEPRVIIISVQVKK